MDPAMHTAEAAEPEVAATTLAGAPLVDADADVAGPEYDSSALGGFVMALAALLILGVVLGPVAIVLSAVGYGRVVRARGALRGKGLAVAGMAIGAIATVAGIYILRLIVG